MIILFILIAIAVGLGIARKYSPATKTQKVVTSILFPVIIGIMINTIIAAAMNSRYNSFWYNYGSAFALVGIPTLALIITLLVKVKVAVKQDIVVDNRIQKLHYGTGENRVDFEMELTEQEIAKMDELRKKDPERWMDNDLELVKAANRELMGKTPIHEEVPQPLCENATEVKTVHTLHYDTGENRVDFEMELTDSEIKKMEELRRDNPEKWLDNDLELVKAAKRAAIEASIQAEEPEEEVPQEELAKEKPETTDVPFDSEDRKEVISAQEEPITEKPISETKVEVKSTPSDNEKRNSGKFLSKWIKILLIIILLLGVLFGLGVLGSFVYTKYIYTYKAKTNDEKLVQEAKETPFRAYEIAQVLFKRGENGHQSEYHDFLTDKQGNCKYDHRKAGMEVANIYCQYCLDSAKYDIEHSAEIAIDMLFKKNDGFCDDLYNKTGVSILKMGAEKEDAYAQFILGCYYGGAEYNKEDGWNKYHTLDGNSVDQSKAAYWYLQSANQGLVQAMCNIGIAYMYGRGVIKNEETGLKWIKQAANGNDAFSQRLLGDLYSTGVQKEIGSHEVVTGYYWDWDYDDYGNFGEHRHANTKTVTDYKTILTADMKQAQYWWRKAADNGDETAKERLQQIFE